MLRDFSLKLKYAFFICFVVFSVSLLHSSYSFADEGGSGDGADVSLHLSVLSDSDTSLYKRIFELQKRHHWREADDLLKKVSDKSLEGYVLADRYLSRYYRSSYKELYEWLKKYSHLDVAKRIYWLARRHRRRHDPYPTRPRSAAVDQGVYHYEITTQLDDASIIEKQQAAYHRSYLPATRYGGHVAWKLRWYMRHRRYSSARWYLRTVLRHRRITTADYGRALAEIVHGYMNVGLYDRAAYYVDHFSARKRRYAPMLMWWGGLVAWKKNDYQKAAEYFKEVAYSPYLDGGMRAAGFFWLSRAYLRLGDMDKVTEQLQKAAYFRYTFYGLLAERALGVSGSFVWTLPSVSQDDVDFLLTIPSVRLAFALASVGQVAYAEREMGHVVPHLPASLSEEILIIANQTGLARVSYSIGRMLRKRNGTLMSVALYPIPIWAPEGGFTVNPALIYGFMRQESVFKVTAHSYAGARGLMQLMPSTASLVGHYRYLGRNKNMLYNPKLNVSLGQKYVRRLIGTDALNNNLFLIVASYNAGVGNVERWFYHYRRYNGDPLLFVETLPNNQTRDYIKKVMANFWVYQYRLGQYQRSMDNILEGKWPEYRERDDISVPIMVAFND